MSTVVICRCLSRYSVRVPLSSIKVLSYCREGLPSLATAWTKCFSYTRAPSGPVKEQNSYKKTMSNTGLLEFLLSKSNEIDVSSETVEQLQELLLDVINSGQRSPVEVDELKEFILSKIQRFKIRFLPVLLATLMKNNLLSRPILDESAVRIRHLLKNNLENYKDVNLGKVLWVLGKYGYYDKELCEAFADIFERGKSLLSPWLVSTIAWHCARVRYYCPTLLDEIAGYTLANIDKCKLHDLSNVVYTFGYLNWPHPTLMEAVGERLERERGEEEGNRQVYWVYVWACLVLDTPRPGVLKRVLSEEFIQASLKTPSYDLCLLQVSIALNFEHPELNMAGEDIHSKQSKWGVCFPTVRGLDSDYMRRSTLARLQRYKHSGSAHRFGENIKRALKQVVGKNMYFNSEALSLSGYSVDFELLFDSRNRLIPIPRRWKMKFKEDVLHSINVVTESKKRASQTLNLIQSLEEAESSSGHTPSDVSVPSSFHYRDQINLASDWGSKFDCVSTRTVRRRLAIEADGLPHFASNCGHVLGPTVLKHRQLRALGWDVVQIPYKEWEGLDSGDDHVKYLTRKIFDRTVK